MNTTTETIRRLDRFAARIGLELRVISPNKREVRYGSRTLRYQPGGKGVIKVESYIGPAPTRNLHTLPDAIAHRSIDGMENLLYNAKYGPNNVETYL